MINVIQEHIDKMLNIYTHGDHYDTSVDAKNLYFELTGTLYEDDDEYEAKMNCFNEWYLFQFLSSDFNSTIVSDYINQNQIDPHLAKCFKGVKYSLYELIKAGNKKILKDHLLDKKIVLPADHPGFGCVENDLFIGRMLNMEDKHYLMKGVCILPQGVKPLLKKKTKIIRKMKDPNEERNYLLTLESLKTRWIRYNHLDLKKIFNFDA